MSPHRRTIRILLADDQSLFRQAMAQALNREPDLEVVGEALDGWEAVSSAQAVQPDVAVIGSDLPGCDGIRAAGMIGVRVPSCQRNIRSDSWKSSDCFQT